MFNTLRLIQATEPESRVRVDRGIAEENDQNSKYVEMQFVKMFKQKLSIWMI